MILGAFSGDALGVQVIDHALDNHFLHIDIVTELADKAEGMEKLLILLREIGKGGIGNVILVAEILQELLGFRLLQGEHLIVHILHVRAIGVAEIAIGDGIQDGLDIADTQNVLEIVDKNQGQHMLLGVFLLLRGRH